MTPEIEEHCQRILSTPRLRSRIVILCEGGTDNINDDDGRLSALSFSRNDRVPDSNFYRNCIPQWWNLVNKPIFINSGDRSKVLSTFFGLLDLYHQNPNESYLDPHKLFALVDLDVQPKSLQAEDVYRDYSVYKDIEEVFKSTYSQGKFKDEIDLRNHIFVTGLVHKEAYFLLQELQDIFNDRQASFEENPLLLADLYPQIAHGITEEQDLKNDKNFQSIQARLQDYSHLDSSTLETLQQSWLDRYDNYQDRPDLITALFLTCKAKPYWESEKLKFTSSKDSVMLAIAKFYKNQGRNFQPHHQNSSISPIDHIPCLFRTIYRIVYEGS